MDPENDDEVPQEQIEDALQENYGSEKETTIQNKRKIKVPGCTKTIK